MVRLFVATLSLLGFLLSAAEPPRKLQPFEKAVIPIFQKAHPEITQFTKVVRRPVSTQSDLLVVLGHQSQYGKPPNLWFQPGSLLGIFLQEQNHPDQLYPLTLLECKENEGGLLRVERLTAHELVLAHLPEKGTQPPHLQLFFDSKKKKLIKQTTYQPFYTAQMVNENGLPHFLQQNGQQIVVLLPSKNGFVIAPPAEALPILKQISYRDFVVDNKPFRIITPEQFFPKFFGPGRRFKLAEEKRATNTQLVITEGTHRFLLPQSTAADWRQARPKLNPYGPGEIEEEIGPYAIEGERLWVGKTFYDSEGVTGVGSFGYFDPSSRQFKLYSPAEIQDWSVSAMLMEPDTIWLALYHRGEWGDNGGGLLRWDRKTETAQRYSFTPIVKALVRYNGHILLGTSEGVAIFEKNRFQEYFVNYSLKGTLHVARK